MIDFVKILLLVVKCCQLPFGIFLYKNCNDIRRDLIKRAGGLMSRGKDDVDETQQVPDLKSFIDNS